MKRIQFALTSTILSFSVNAFAFEEITAQEAYDAATMSGAHIIDVRTGGEFIWVGHPDVSNISNISSMVNTNNKMTVNPLFVEDVNKVFGDQKDTQIIMICRSGGRSAVAAAKLEDAGYTNIYNMSEGFEGGSKDDYGNRNINGWKNSSLPIKTSSIGAADVYNNTSNTVTLSENLDLNIKYSPMSRPILAKIKI